MAISLNLPHTEVIKAKFFTFNNLYTAYYTSGWYLSLLIPYVITSVIMLMSLIVSVYIAQKEKYITTNNIISRIFYTGNYGNGSI